MIWNALTAYGWWGIATFLVLIAYRGVRMLTGSVSELIPYADPRDPVLGHWNKVQITALLLACCLIAWPAVIALFFTKETR